MHDQSGMRHNRGLSLPLMPGKVFYSSVRDCTPSALLTAFKRITDFYYLRFIFSAIIGTL